MLLFSDTWLGLDMPYFSLTESFRPGGQFWGAGALRVMACSSYVSC